MRASCSATAFRPTASWSIRARRSLSLCSCTPARYEIADNLPSTRRGRRSRVSPPLHPSRKGLRGCNAKGGLAWRSPYVLNQWEDLVRFLEDGRIELDTNAVERQEGVLAGHDEGARTGLRHPLIE